MLLKKSGDFATTVSEQSNLILSFILITGVIQLLTKYIKKTEEESVELSETNRRLVIANEEIKQSMDYIMELYRVTQLFTRQESKNNLIQLMLHYGRKITKNSGVLFIYPNKSNTEFIIQSDKLSKDLKEEIRCEVIKKWSAIIKKDTPVELNIKSNQLLLISIKSSYRVYGILGIDITYVDSGVSYKETLEQLKFLSNLSSITLEKFQLEQVNEELLISEEQNRIANEIHDSVLQRLFSVSCSMFTTIKSLRMMKAYKIEAELNTMRACMNSVVKDLRATIYGLSWTKDGVNNFIVNIENYLNEMRALNNIIIRFNPRGNHELLCMTQKKALYRMICEGIGNATRHGSAQEIEVTLEVKEGVTSLQIIDNGIGFDAMLLEKNKKMGLGIRNIFQLTCSLNGRINLNSQIGMGTKIDITIPNDIPKTYKEEVV
ncbi:sensor histidine kinase [Clostridium aceticum]|uniref:sensor histidine kinase n=1 Tax=Clostridium aceticum TaxID=84022 RepID=UPI00130E2FA7|nr:ATP-binding protein [Clostridium aceticum]